MTFILNGSSEKNEYVEENRTHSGVLQDEERDLVFFICNDV
jgi:hypothetical protein